MQKPIELKALLQQTFVDLQQNPDKLIMLVENGKIIAQPSTLNFKKEYVLTVSLLDFSSFPDQLFCVINQWLQTHQPDLLRHPDKARDDYQFEAEMLSKDQYDLTIRLRLTESLVVKTQDKQHSVSSRPEPTHPYFKGGL